MKKTFSHLFFLFAIICIQCSCSLDGTSWDIDGKGPVLQTQFDLSQAIPDPHLQYAADSAIMLNFYDTVYTVDVDSIAYIPDSSYLFNITWTLPNINLQPGVSLPAFPIKIRFGIHERIKLNAARIKSGRLKIKIKSVIPRKINIQYNIPNATYYGIPFSLSETIPAASAGDTIVYSTQLNLKDYYVDLRGPNLNEYNVLYIYLTPTLNENEPALPLSTGQFLFSTENTLEKVNPFYAQGFVVPATDSINSNIIDLGTSRYIRSGILDIDSIRMGITLVNTMGVDMRLKIDKFRSINDATGQQIELTHPIINSFINLQTAQNTYNTTNPVLPYNYTLWLTPQNSNLDQLIENIPDRFRINSIAQINPMGDATADNNFFYTTVPPRFIFHIQAPVKFSVYQIQFIDTLDNPLFEEIEIEKFLSGEFRIIAENKFPLALAANIYTLDDAGLLTDTLFTQSLISPAPVNAANRVTFPLISNLLAPFNEAKIKNITSARRIVIKARFNSVPNLQLLQMYSDYYLKLKILADVKYRITL